MGSNYCLDDLMQNNEQPYNMGLYSCSEQLTKTQLMSYTKTQVLRNELSCATVQHSDSPPHLVVMTPCLEDDDYNEPWRYEKQHFIHSNTGLCLDRKGLRNMDEVQVSDCDYDSETQKWVIQH